MKIALDAMGGDRAPAETVNGALIAAAAYDVEVALVGSPERLEAELRKHKRDPRLSIVPAGEPIDMGQDDVVHAVRSRRDAPINVAMSLVRDGQADACVSAGNTGSVMASAFFNLGRVRGIERPAIATLLPYNAGRVLLLDAGANADCRPNHLVQFAQMGSVYSERVIGVRNPRIGLLNTGEESSKGSEVVKEAHARLRETTNVNFVGNVEGQEVHRGICDVIVTDGFTGNIALKVGEGIADYILAQVRLVIEESSPLFVGAAVLLKPALKRALKSLNYEEYGGANLLGINGIVVIAHGRSDALAIKNALRVAHAEANSGLLDAMRASFGDVKEATPAAGK